MQKNHSKRSLKDLARFLYIKLVRINDSPQRIALGFGIGVFFGIIPGLGPLASLFVASLIKVNRAGALIGSILTNTWTSLVAFLISVKIGSFLMGIDWQLARDAWYAVFKNFHFNDLSKVSFFKAALPTIIGYLVVAAVSGLLAYFAVLLFLNYRKKFRKIKKASQGA